MDGLMVWPFMTWKMFENIKNNKLINKGSSFKVNKNEVKLLIGDHLVNY